MLYVRKNKQEDIHVSAYFCKKKHKEKIPKCSEIG